MIDSTPRGRQVFEETGKWPSELAAGTERDPDNVAPLVVYLASDAAAGVNGQAFHAYKFGYSILAQPHVVRAIRADRRWEPEELARVFPATLGAGLEAPPASALGPALDARPAAEWTPIEGGTAGQRLWRRPRAAPLP
jgi:hypothetical protein